VKLFVTATPEVRAERRLKELLGRGMNAHYDDVLADIRARDARDSGRDVAPLTLAADAILLDTSELGPDEAITEAVRLAEQRLEEARVK
jgi:cytidylate kinase